MTEKEIFVTLAKAYIDTYNKDNKVNDILHSFGITFEDEERPVVSATEAILEKIAGDRFHVIENLIDINDNGSIDFYYSSDAVPTDKDKVEIKTVEKLYDFYKSNETFIMTEKEIFVILAKAYIEDYNKSCAIYSFLHPLGITLEDEEKPLISATEKILEAMVEDVYVTEALFDINKYGYTAYYTYNPIDGGEKETEHRMSSTEELYDFYKS